MTQTTVDRAGDEAKLAPEVRNALLALIVGGIAAILDSTMVTIALHTLAVSLHSTDGAIQWVTTGYLLAMAVATPVTGWAESRWGGKRVWMAALVLFVAGSVLCALAWSDAGRPDLQRLRIHACPIESPGEPGPQQFVLTRPHTRLVLEWMPAARE